MAFLLRKVAPRSIQTIDVVTLFIKQVLKIR
jgi:hypothetical protein